MKSATILMPAQIYLARNMNSRSHSSLVLDRSRSHFCNQCNYIARGIQCQYQDTLDTKNNNYLPNQIPIHIIIQEGKKYIFRYHYVIHDVSCYIFIYLSTITTRSCRKFT